MIKKRKKIINVLVILLVLIVTVSLTLGKYIYNSVWNYYLTSKGFYFESDLLDINVKKNFLLKWDGSNIYFLIKNAVNSELISEYDISYKITCEVLGDEANYIDCNLNGEETSIFNGILSSNANCINNIDMKEVSMLTKTECEMQGYTWQNEITSKNHYFTLFLKDTTKNIDEVSVKITAESIKPYKQTLIGIFNLNKVDIGDDEIITHFQSFSEYDELSIINKTPTDKCLLISFNPNDYLFDLDAYSVLNYAVNANNKINKINLKIEKQSSLIYNFYKLDSEKSYSINDFNIEEKEC